jgi:hypothetical protein
MGALQVEAYFRPVRHRVGNGRAVRTWPEGRICSGCFAQACETYGVCPACGTHRLLPARRIDATGNHQPSCADCSPGVGDFTCTRCGQEGWHHYKGVCGRCVLGDRLARHLDDGTGRVRPELAPLYDRIVAMPRPRTGILWLSKPHVGPILRALAHEHVPLTHDGLSTLTPLRSVVHIRDLLMASGVLPARDRHLVLFEQWLDAWLEDVQSDRDNGPVRGTRRQPMRPRPRHRRSTCCASTRPGTSFAVCARLLTAAPSATTAISEPVTNSASQHSSSSASTTMAWTYLGAAKAISTPTSPPRGTHQGKPCGHSWSGPSGTHHLRRLTLPLTRQMPPRPISLHDRVKLLQRIAAGVDMDLTERVIGTLILLYAQPLSRIVRLTVDDILTDPQGRVLIRLRDPPAPIPSPFDDIVRSHLRSRHNLDTATNPNSTWLFSGRRADPPLHPTSIRLRLTTLGHSEHARSIPRTARNAPSSTTCGRGQHARLPRRQSGDHRRRNRCDMEALRRRHSRAHPPATLGLLTRRRPQGR